MPDLQRITKDSGTGLNSGSAHSISRRRNNGSRITRNIFNFFSQLCVFMCVDTLTEAPNPPGARATDSCKPPDPLQEQSTSLMAEPVFQSQGLQEIFCCGLGAWGS